VRVWGSGRRRGRMGKSTKGKETRKQIIHKRNDNIKNNGTMKVKWGKGLGERRRGREEQRKETKNKESLFFFGFPHFPVNPKPKQ
jgi:hypothetical protein